MVNIKAEARPNQKPHSGRERGPKIRPLTSRFKGMPFEEGLARADRENLVIVSDRRLTRVQEESEEWWSIHDIFHCWSGTMVAYSEPGKPFGAFIEYKEELAGRRWVFPVPQHLRHEKDAILMADHPDFTLELDGNNRVVHVPFPLLVRDFASETGWYLVDHETKMPTGSPVDYTYHEARFLWRADKPRVAPVSICAACGRYMRMYLSPASRFGMAVEEPILHLVE